MHTIIQPIKNDTSRTSRNVLADFRSPQYDCRDQAGAMKLEIYVPGVAASGVEITLRGPDLIVTALKSHVVRVNFNAAHLECAQKDYRLVLRVGHGFTAEGLHAEIDAGILTVTLPKRARTGSTSPLPSERVA